MKTKFDKIYLCWRPQRGTSRIIIAEITKSTEGVCFSYIKDGIKKASKDNFLGYPGLPLERNFYDDIMPILSRRIINTARTDINSLLDFWEIDIEDKDDKFYLLGMTQGLMSNDNFEFLADYKYSADLKFVTDLAGIAFCDIDSQGLNIGDFLDYELDPSNPHDCLAVKVYKQGHKVGYIKAVHSRVFHEYVDKKIKIQIKDILFTSRGDTQIFVKIYVGSK